MKWKRKAFSYEPVLSSCCHLFEQCLFVHLFNLRDPPQRAGGTFRNLWANLRPHFQTCVELLCREMQRGAQFTNFWVDI